MQRSVFGQAIGGVLVCLALSPLHIQPASAADLPVTATPGAVLATVEQNGGQAQATIMTLKRADGDTVMLRFTIDNRGRDLISMIMAGPAGGTMAELKLVDLVSRRVYFPGAASDDLCTAPRDEKATCWAVFAAPPAGTRSLNVQIKGFDLVSVPLQD